VGKTSMIQRFCKNDWVDSYKKTIGVDFVERNDYEVEGIDDPVTMHVWDTAGQEEYDAVTSQYYRGADACILAFSTLDDASFKAVKKWKAKVEEHCSNFTNFVIVQNKVDMIAETKVSKEDAEGLADELNLQLFRASVKENVNIDEAFSHLALGWHQARNQANTQQAVPAGNAQGQSKDSVNLAPKKRGTEKKKGCC